MANKSYNKCIEDNDWKTAIWNFENTTKRWKTYWWDCLTKLYHTCKDFAKTYILDNLTMTLRKVGAAIKEDFKEFCYYNTKGNYTYIIEYYDENDNFIWLKVGKTTQPLKDRIKQHRDYYIEHANIKLNAKVKKVFSFDTEQECIDMEDTLRDFYRNYKGSAYIPKDRFLMIHYNEKELEKFLKSA